MSKKIIERIERDTGVPNLASLLSEKLSGSDLHSLLLTILKSRIENSGTSNLSRLDAACLACDLDARLIQSLEIIAFKIAKKFDALDLAPLLPLGSISNLTNLDQANVLSTIRAYECASDPTVGMALEAAKRRKEQKHRSQTLRFCTNQRVLRFPLPKVKGFTAHFKLLALLSAFRNKGNYDEEIGNFLEHISFYLEFLERLQKEGYAISNIKLEISDTRIMSALVDQAKVSREDIKARVRAKDKDSAKTLLKEYEVDWPEFSQDPLEDLRHYNLPDHLKTQTELINHKVFQSVSQQFPSVGLSYNLQRLTGLGYYNGLCFHIKITNSKGEEYMIADGGLVDWTKVLLNDKKERLMTSAIGSELLIRMFYQKQ